MNPDQAGTGQDGTSESCVRCLVGGRVQGVFYRASTQGVARQLGLSGYARNLPDGRVEVLACGQHESVERLRNWLWEGPPMARVDSVSCEPAVREGVVGFHAR